MIRLLRILTMLATCASGLVFAFLSKDIGWWCLFAGYFGHIYLAHRENMSFYARFSQLVDDRSACHQKLLDGGQTDWVLEQLLMIGERDHMPEEIRARVRNIMALRRALVDAPKTNTAPTPPPGEYS